MEIVKVGLVMVAGLGSTWAAQAVTDAVFGAPQGQALVQAAEPRSTAGGRVPSPPAAAAESAPPAATKIPDLSRQEMEDELRRAQAEISGKGGAGETEEFRPSRPLPADLPIALPSDI